MDRRTPDAATAFDSHGISDPATAKHQAIVAIGNTVKRQALIFAFSDTFAVKGVVLAVAAIALLSHARSQVDPGQPRIDS